MIPSRGPIQVSLDDTESRAVRSCQPQASIQAVKILRRPKPVGAEEMILGNGAPASASANKLPQNIGNNGRLFQKSNPLCEEQWPSIADAAARNFRSHPPDQEKSRQLGNSSSSSSVLNSGGCGATQRVADGTVTNFPAVVATNQDSAAINKRPIATKSYKERADEYAKARLRILGSAFSEDEKQDEIGDHSLRLGN